ncbi:TIGR02680 family protein [Nocardioides sp. AN3]
MTEVDNGWLAPSRASAELLPQPTTERWQPLRLGLVDMFYYDDEQFWFHDGRLLLRGNNGTGKSKVLALTLPFLLDGSIAPRRVEPDADPKKRMEWNLLLGGAHSSSERTGYTWMEFGRRAADGTVFFTTLGIGLKAAAGRGIVKTWYFTTTRRIGDLRLVDESRTVLGNDRLREAIGTSGAVHATQEAYRRAVDEALFGLGEARYAALIDLLIQLRQPQLSKRPDEKALSAALTEALAPLDQAVVADVAESFRSLEEEREGIAESRETLRAAEDFLKHYRVYAEVAARRHTTAVRTSNSKYEHAGRDLREAEEALTAISSEMESLGRAQAQAEEHQGVLEGQAEALRDSPAMREAEGLRMAEKAATEAEASASREEADVAAAAAVGEREAVAARDAEEKRDLAARDAAERERVAAALAIVAGLGEEHPGLVADRVQGERALARRREQIAQVRRFADETQQARARSATARVRLDEADAAAARRAEAVQAARALLDESGSGYRTLVADYLDSLRLLHPGSDADALADLAEEWARSLSGASPARAALEAAATAAFDVVGHRRARAEQSRGAAQERLTQISERIADLASGRDPEPPPSPGRESTRRTGSAGAPLWQVVDFVEGMSDGDRAGLEAALQSAGLLDAWIFPDGTLSVAGDVVLGPAGATVADPVLGTALRAAIGPESDVSKAAAEGVLARIGHGESSGAALWVDAQGRWGAGPARGTWAKAQAEYVGAGARSAYRQQVLAGLREEKVRIEQEIADLDALLAGLAEERSEVADELRRYPHDAERALVDVHAQVGHAEREAVAAQAAVAVARDAWEQADTEAEERAAQLAEAAGDLGLGTTPVALDEALQAVGDYDKALVELRAARHAAEEAAVAGDQARRRAEDAAATLREREARARSRRTEATGLRARADRLRATVGASVAELERQLAEIAGATAAAKAELNRLAQAMNQASGRRGGLEEKVRELGIRREEAATEREDRILALRAFTATGLLRVALPELSTPHPNVADEWNLTASVGLARAAEARLTSVDESDEAWLRVQQRVSTGHTELAAQMSRRGHTAIMDQRGDVSIARVRYLSEEVDVDRLARRISDDLADRERLLTAKEREILENHLVNEVAGHLHELLQRAQEQIDQMNRELSTRKTSTGMQLRVQWRERADGPTGLAAARDLMLRSDATWTPADRTAIGDFLQARIAEERQADPTGSWVEHLESALDYRRWHAFSVERFQNGSWRSASGPSSGGEKVLAVSVPLFAAATSHYNSAGPLAPRLILLDEAFAGVDDDSRAKSLGLLATFDLDVVMTSEREWGCYPQVPGLAIAQLSRIEGVDAVGVTRWRWDGRRRQRLGEIDDSARAGDPSRSDGGDAEAESLFA